MKKDFEEFKEFIKGKNTAVVGIGVSNIPLIRFLLELGARVSAFDKKNEEQLGEIAEEFKSKGVKLVLGDNYLDNLIGFEVIFKTPSMRIDSPFLVKAKEEGAYITSEMEEFVKYCPAKVFGVTGSDGKTTTTSLIYNILKEEGYKTWVGGNIGTPLFAQIEEIQETDRVVLELSSFQLMTMKVSPEVSIVTNLSPNHLDMHKDMEEYVDSKKNIYKYQDNDGVLVLNRDNEITNSMVNEAKGRVLQFSIKETIENGAYYKDESLYLLGKEVCKAEDIVIVGMHNVENYLASFCALSEDASIESMKKVATTFKGVEHRIEFVRELEGIKYYNSSIASSPSRTLADIKVFGKPVILIAGGYDKKIPFEPLAEEGYPYIKKLVLLGATKEKIRNAFEKIIDEKNLNLPIITADTLEEAVIKSTDASEKGDVVILAPACASFDMFVNFEVRGNEFKKIVNNLK
ncbi:UDP-N-acetylmuramoyl-L-alanine--D-glutamate ligase [Clostridium sp. YIM B02515]|uniref:UDP-N-acetylmuramoylalanine--D-glutamate ligase n=1 Tax=Clostridium rhizosphaerae TaxID=2803861 RepID=A0ABS1TGS5_9CLOT|nr:UDP-N-acetylmuramoyl-L-alanine--D-glutamate ligase [Clostridium rhizosphaerae]MBL4937133.1 UDP-N-acetylmuramoyl-L-alanine--D-glutamate ligase [Clostridium rhizosphaerae]